MNGVDPGLLRFCLQHSDGSGLADFGERPKEDWLWLKEALANFETPGKKVQKLVSELSSAADAQDTEKMLFCLRSLNEEVEDVDQSSVVANAGGLELLLALCRHASSKDIRWEALYGVQLLVKNNEPLILLAKKLGALPHLMQLLPNPTEDVGVKGRALSAISALIDHQPDLQSEFLRSKGLELAAEVISAARALHDEKIQFRTVFGLLWLLQNRPDFNADFRKSTALNTQLRFSQNSTNVELKEAATELLQLILAPPAADKQQPMMLMLG